MLDIWFGDPDYKKEIVRTSGPAVLTEIERDVPKCYPIYREHTRILFENFLKISGCL
jgi:GMP synthase (glutamine-hydrolysing)